MVNDVTNPAKVEKKTAKTPHRQVGLFPLLKESGMDVSNRVKNQKNLLCFQPFHWWVLVVFVLIPCWTGLSQENLFAQSKMGAGLQRTIGHPVKTEARIREEKQDHHFTLLLKDQSESALSAISGAGFRIQTQLGSLITVSGPVDRLPDLMSVPFVQWIEDGPADSPLMNTSRSTLMSGSTWIGTWTDSVHASGLTGENALIGVVDDGFSIASGDYQTISGATRIAWIWNQATNTPARYPTQPAYSYGTEWSSADIDEGLVTGLPGSSHGSVCLSIAASDGSQSGIKGMAPSAGIILVIRKSGSTLSNTVDAFNYIQKKAKAMNRPVAISYSLGSQFGPHDGTKLHELAIDSLSGPGVIFAIAAGNNGGQSIHLSGAVPPAGFSDSVTVSITSNDQTNGKAFAVNNWFPPGDSIDIRIKSPSGTRYGPFIRRSVYDTLSTPDGFLYVQNTLDPVSNLVGIDWELINFNNRKVKTGTWTIIMSTRHSQTGGNWDGWVYLSSIPGSVQTHVNSERTLTMPATAREAIAVAAYEKGTGLRQSSSSTGPTRDGRMKPEVTAPSNVNSGAGSLGGTSASAPHMAGLAALLFQADPELTPEQIKGLIQTGSRTDSQTGSTPNYSWGFGKLNSYYTALAQNPGLPVEITGFRAFLSGNQLLAFWEVVHESELAGYVLQMGNQAILHFSEDPSLQASGRTSYQARYSIQSVPAPPVLTLQAIGLDGRIHQEISTTVTDQSEKPDSFHANPPYPNPGNPSLQLPVTLFRPSMLTLSLYSVTGQEIWKQTFRGEAGSHSIGVSATGLASGVYILHVTDSFHSQSFRLMILR